jgi:cytochrome P450
MVCFTLLIKGIGGKCPSINQDEQRKFPFAPDDGGEKEKSSRRQLAKPHLSSRPIPRFAGSERALIKAPHLFFLQLTQTYGDMVQYGVSPAPAYLLNHPDYARHILVDNGRNYNKNTHLNKYMLEALTGQGLLTSENPLWRKQRRLIQPAFHRHSLAKFADLMVAATQLTQRQIARYAAAGQPFDIANEMMKLTLDIVTSALFSFDIGPWADVMGEAINTMSHIAKPKHPRVKEAVRVVDEIVFEIIEQRRQDPDPEQDDLLAMLLNARYEDSGESMSNRQVRDEVMSLLVAGHETTANTLSWTWYLLGQNPDVVITLIAELDALLGGRPPALADFPALVDTNQVIKEAMRLYPSAWSISRRALADDIIDGYHIPAGAIVAISPYTLHRHPEFWPSPERFCPQRFTPEAEQAQHRYAYIPFGAGMRKCIGDQFALMESMIIVPMLLQSFQLALVPGHPVEGHAKVTLRPKHGVLMTAVPR